MANLRHVMIYEILSLLPVKSLVRFKSVSKEWYNLIQSSDFVEYHHSRSLETYNDNCSLIMVESFVGNNIKLYHVRHDLDKTTFAHCIEFKLPWKVNEVVGSSRGLICIKSKEGIALCNPTLRVIKPIELPIKKIRFQIAPIGFGFDCLSDDYKIVLNLNQYTWGRPKHTWVYSLTSDSWRNTECTHDSSHYNEGVFNNNRLHWLSYHHDSIACFDLGNEEWSDMTILPNCQNINILLIHLGEFDGCLCLCFETRPLPIDSIAETHVWIMAEYGVQESSVPLLYFHDVLAYPLNYSNDQTGVIFRSPEGTLYYHELYGDDIEEPYDYPTCLQNDILHR